MIILLAYAYAVACIHDSILNSKFKILLWFVTLINIIKNYESTNHSYRYYFEIKLCAITFAYQLPRFNLILIYDNSPLKKAKYSSTFHVNYSIIDIVHRLPALIFCISNLHNTSHTLY